MFKNVMTGMFRPSSIDSSPSICWSKQKISTLNNLGHTDTMDESKSQASALVDLGKSLATMVQGVHIIQLPKHAAQLDGSLTTRGAHTVKHWREVGIPHTIHTGVVGVDEFPDTTQNRLLMTRVSGWQRGYNLGSTTSTDAASKCATLGVSLSFVKAAIAAMDCRGTNDWIAIVEDDVLITQKGAAALTAALKHIPSGVEILQLAANCLTKFGRVPVVIDEHWCRVHCGTGGMMYLIKVPEDGSLPPFVQRVKDSVDSIRDPSSTLVIQPVDVAILEFSEQGKVATTRFGCITSFADMAGGKTSSDTVGMPINYDAALSSGRWRKCCMDSSLCAKMADIVHEHVVHRPQVGRKKCVVHHEMYATLKERFAENSAESIATSVVDATMKQFIAMVEGCIPALH